MPVPNPNNLPPAQPEKGHIRRAIAALFQRGERISAEHLEAYERARKELMGQILSGDDGPVTANRLRLLLSEIEPRLDRLASELHTSFRDVMRREAMAEIAQAQAEIKRLVPAAIREGALMPPKIPDRMVSAVIEHGAMEVRTPIEALKTNIRRELTQSMINGDHVHPTAKRILALKDSAGNQALTLEGLKKPVFKTAEERAIVIARTELSKAANASHIEQYLKAAERFPTLVIRWSSSMCSQMCKVCTAMNGKKVRPGENFPCGVAAPPLHPRCRCRVVSMILSEEEYTSLFGPVPERVQAFPTVSEQK